MFIPLRPPSVQKVRSIKSGYALQGQILHGYSESAVMHSCVHLAQAYFGTGCK